MAKVYIEYTNLGTLFNLCNLSILVVIFLLWFYLHSLIKFIVVYLMFVLLDEYLKPHCFIFWFVFFWVMVPKYNPDCPGNHYVDQDVIKFTDICLPLTPGDGIKGVFHHAKPSVLIFGVIKIIKIHKRETNNWMVANDRENQAHCLEDIKESEKDSKRCWIPDIDEQDGRLEVSCRNFNRNNFLQMEASTQDPKKPSKWS